MNQKAFDTFLAIGMGNDDVLSSINDAAIDATATMSAKQRATYISNLLKLIDQASWMTINSAGAEGEIAA